MLRSVLIAYAALVLAATYATAANVGDDAPPLNRPEVVTAGGGYGPNINIDDLLGKVVVVNFWAKS